MAFEVGQKVRVKKPSSTSRLGGKVGEVYEVHATDHRNLYRVVLGVRKRGRKLLFWESELELVKEEGA